MGLELLRIVFNNLSPVAQGRQTGQLIAQSVRYKSGTVIVYHVHMSDGENSEAELVKGFLYDYFPDNYTHDPSQISDAEQAEIKELMELITAKFVGQDSRAVEGVLNLGIDFVLLSEIIAQSDDWLNDWSPDLGMDEVESRYENTGEQTLTLQFDGGSQGIRGLYEDVGNFFQNDLNRTNFPWSPQHHTNNWEGYVPFWRIFRLSRAGRYELADRLFSMGLERFQGHEFQSRDPPFPDPFLAVLNDFERSVGFEEGGTAYQAMAFGYVTTEWSHLSFQADKLRTGSSRQNRYGDIDGYYGPDHMLSVEVKDRVIDTENVLDELGGVVSVASDSTAVAVAICKEVSEDAREILNEEGVQVITDEDLRAELQQWDYHKQNDALQGMVHFYSDIERNPPGVQRLLNFVNEVDPNNPALAHLDKSEK